MKKIFVIGAGFSTKVLIEYLLKNAAENSWFITVGDINIETANQSIGNSQYGKAIKFDVHDTEQREAEISQADIVVSMLPARFHYLAAETCLKLGKNLVTASYVSEQMASLNEKVKEKGLLFMNEIGLDPGIDHISAMLVIDDLKSKGADIQSFKSFTGGLIAPKYDNNP